MFGSSVSDASSSPPRASPATSSGYSVATGVEERSGTNVELPIEVPLTAAPRPPATLDSLIINKFKVLCF